MHARSLHISLSAVIWLLVAAPSHSDSPDQYKASAAKALRAVKLADGVSRSEASAIAEYFFYYHQNVGCGAPGSVKDSGDSWDVSTRLGFAGDPGDPIVINKVTGAVHWGGQLCVVDPTSMLSKPEGASSCVPANS
jgi:hypothetical protein